MRNILFICTGNFYRSRYAEAVFNHLALRRRLHYAAFSRGLAIHMAEGDLSPHTERALNAEGVPLTHTSPTRTPLALADLERAYRCIALKESEHRPMMAARFPGWAQRIEYWQVHDLDLTTPAVTLSHIRARVSTLVRTLRDVDSVPPPR